MFKVKCYGRANEFVFYFINLKWGSNSEFHLIGRTIQRLSGFYRVCPKFDCIISADFGQLAELHSALHFLIFDD